MIKVNSKKIVFIHAHPDDETITTGLTIAKFIDDGHEVIVINLSGGESGGSYLEEYPPGTQAFRDKIIEEHSLAMQRLGVKKFFFIGPYHDSPPKIKIENLDKTFLSGENIDTLVEKITLFLKEECPDLIITYDKNGWSGHPDHIVVHKAVVAAAKKVEIKNLWFTAIPTQMNSEGIDKKGNLDRFWISEYTNPDIEISSEKARNKKNLALAEYKTQIKINEKYWTLVGMEYCKNSTSLNEWFMRAYGDIVL